MSRGLYTVAEVARYLRVRPQEAARMVKEDGLPVVNLPGKSVSVRKVTLHGLHEWMKGRHEGAAFMSVDELAAEMAAANAGDGTDGLGLLTLRSAVELVFESIKGRLGEGTPREVG